MKTIAAEALSEQIEAVLDEVAKGQTFALTVRGKPVATIRAFTDEDSAQYDAEWQRWLEDFVAAGREMTRNWPAGRSAAEAVAQDRREL